MSEERPSAFLPYSRPVVTEADIAAVCEALRDPIISQGKKLEAFESAFSEKMEARHAVALSSGTAALHAMCFAAGIGTGDEVIVPPLTFAGTANAILYCGGKPVFADVDPATHCLDPEAVLRAISTRTRAILTVDFAGHPSPYADLDNIARSAGVPLLADAAHAPGARYRGQAVGSALATMTAFSFNPVKNMTTGEGGMVTTDNDDLAATVRQFRVHGMTRNEYRLEQPAPGGWYYEQQYLGFNYKLSEMHAALGTSQLDHLDTYNGIRCGLARNYADAFLDLPLILPDAATDVHPAWHLYVIRVRHPYSRDALFAFLRALGIGVQVHYIPVPLHPHYQRLGYALDSFPEAKAYYKTALSLPLHPAMTEGDSTRVIDAVHAFFHRARSSQAGS